MIPITKACFSPDEGDSGEVIPRFFAWALNRMAPVILGDDSQTRNFICVEETGYSLRRVAECDDLIGQTINLGSGKETLVLELTEVVFDEILSRRIPPEFHPPRPGDVQRHLAGTERAREVLGFHTRISLREGIRRLGDYLRAAGGGAEKLLERTEKINWIKEQGK